mmetsp:Transcript_16499/g.29788  ORF Transcript_16499/g.29788 Transcript_16499/m.29788 type:complete len:83 (-) Transcript_16499:1626-1874(-)
MSLVFRLHVSCSKRQAHYSSETRQNRNLLETAIPPWGRAFDVSQLDATADASGKRCLRSSSLSDDKRSITLPLMVNTVRCNH